MSIDVVTKDIMVEPYVNGEDWAKYVSITSMKYVMWCLSHFIVPMLTYHNKLQLHKQAEDFWINYKLLSLTCFFV